MRGKKRFLALAGAVLIALSLGVYLVKLTARQRASDRPPGESVTADAEPAIEDVSESAQPSASSTIATGGRDKLDAEWLIQQVDQWKPGWTEKISPAFLEDPANAFNRFLFAAALLDDGRQFQEVRYLLGSRDFSWTTEPEKVALVQAYLDANAEALAALKAGIKEAEYYQGPPFFFQESDASTYHDRFRTLARLLRGEALVLHARGAAESGLVDSLLGLQMARHMMGGNISIETTYGAFIHQVGGKAFEFLLPEVRGPALCREAIAQLDQLLSRDAYRVGEEFHIEAGSVDPRMLPTLTSMQQEAREAVGILNDALDLPYREFASLSRPPNFPEFSQWDSIKASASTLYREKASMVAYKTLAAVKAYQLETGDFPETLGELVPEYLPEIPMDPFIGEPFKYVRSEDAVVVYAVGFDLKDDGGKRVGSTLNGKGDYVFQVR